MSDQQTIHQRSRFQLVELSRLFLGLIRFSHTIFALPFALLAALISWTFVPFSWVHLVAIVLCMVMARSAAMAYNRLADQDIDGLNPRTANRHLPAGLLSSISVKLFIVFCSVGFIASTLLFLPNRLPLYLSVPVLLFLFAYSHVKRFSSLAHFWLGAALMLSPIAVWIALVGSWNLIPISLAAVIFFWVGGFDIIYACQDFEFDVQQKLHSVPAKLGIKSALRVAAVSHAVCWLCLLWFWWAASLSHLFLVAILMVAILLIYEHRLIRPDDLDRANLAFFHVNAVISFGLFVAGWLDLALFA